MEVGGSSRKRSKCVQSRKEKEVLLNILKDVVLPGQYYDISFFKYRTINMIERWLVDRCYNSNLKVNPYIESKLKLWKKQYNIVYDMLNKIAFEWNDSK